MTTFSLYDLQSNTVNGGTLSNWLSADIEVIHNQGRKFTIELPIDNYAHDHTDGFPFIEEGDRKLVVEWEGQTVFHGRVGLCEYTGDGTTNKVKLTAFDTWMELGFEAGNIAGRVVRDDTGNFISPVFNSGGPIRGGDLVQQILTNIQQTGDESDPTPGEGPLPIDMSLSTFDTSVPGESDAENLSPSDAMPWPMMVGDFFTQITETNITDINYTPLAIGASADPYAMCSVQAVDTAGTNLSGSVNFDYWTGDFNASTARYTGDFSTVCNKLYDYLGPRGPFPGEVSSTSNQWRGNITPGSPGTTVDPTASRARYGTFMQVRIFDALQTENYSRRLYLALWNAEAALRLNGRKLLYLNPLPGTGALFQPFLDYNASDLITVNTGAAFGVGIGATQRVMGFNGHWDRSGVLVVDRLLTTADAG